LRRPGRDGVHPARRRRQPGATAPPAGPAVIGFLVHPSVDTQAPPVAEARAFLERSGIEVWMATRDGRPRVLSRTRLLVTLGGDGLIRLRLTVDGQEVGQLDADGAIVATATGSTAYALAAGGPILEPAIEDLLLVPLNPFALTVRPIVFPPRQQLVIELSRSVG